MDQYSSNLRHVVFVGNHLPRRCGIATFTSDLATAVARELPEIKCEVVAMNEAGASYAYGGRVRFQIAENDPSAYRRAADFLNVGGAEVLSLQHEYGIFGGKAGSYVLSLLRELRSPVVTTLHTILPEPSAEQRRVMDQIAATSARMVVMSRHGSELLSSIHGVDPEKIDVIPHGIPDFPHRQQSKQLLGLAGKHVILTFGLLSPDKGIEYMIEALPRIAATHPDAVYVIVGTTHPHVKRRHGEVYRESLAFLAQRLGVEANVVFHDRFVTLAELAEFLSAADVYVTPYLNAEQSTSGTLAYAFGAGKAVVSTAYCHAKELLDDSRGVLVPRRDSAALGDAIVSLLDDPARRERLGANAAAHAKEMAWPAVARRYAESFERAKREHSTRRRTAFEAKSLAQRPLELPTANYAHLRLMTDDTGLLQHAKFSIPRYEDGYCLDDNARALLLMALLEDAGAEDPAAVRTMASRYLSFVSHAFDERAGHFRNFMSFGRRWTEHQGSEDSQGRALWALGAMVGRAQDPGRESLSGHLFHAALPVASSLESPRGRAFALLGISEYLRAFKGDSSVEAVGRSLADRLLVAFDAHSRADWLWCEEQLTYDNARLPQALIAFGALVSCSRMTGRGLAALDWLARMQTSDDDEFTPIGSDGFYRRGGVRPYFDQQPLEACATISACHDAWKVTGKERWAREMRRAFGWFLGQNALQASLYDPSTGGCRDGLHAQSVNENQGAESTLSFLLSLTELRMFESEVCVPPAESPEAERGAG